MAHPIESPPSETVIRTTIGIFVDSLGSTVKRLAGISSSFFGRSRNSMQGAQTTEALGDERDGYAFAENLKEYKIKGDIPVFRGCVTAGEIISKISQEPDYFGSDTEYGGGFHPEYKID